MVIYRMVSDQGTKNDREYKTQFDVLSAPATHEIRKTLYYQAFGFFIN